MMGTWFERSRFAIVLSGILVFTVLTGCGGGGGVVIVILRSFAFSATGGVAPHSYAITAGAGSIDASTGLYTAPAATGTATVRVTDSLGNASSSTITIIKPTAIAAGGSHSCALFSDGSVKCWGSNAYRQLGLGNTTNRGSGANHMGDNLPFISLGTGRTATAIAAGANHTCALLDNSALKCWGYNAFGQLGLGHALDQGVAANQMGDNLNAVSLGTGRTALSLSAGASHTCARLDNNTLKCWGLNADGQLGQENTTNYGSAGGQMGDALLAIALGTGRSALEVSAGGNHTCARLDNNTVKCWGYNLLGQLGQGKKLTVGDSANQMGNSLPASALGTGRTALGVIAGTSHSCARLDNSTVKCWGSSTNGQGGLGTTQAAGDNPNEMGDNLAAISLGTGRTVVSLSSTGNHACALLDNDTVKCWGSNASGQLGLGDIADRGSAAGQMGDSLAAVSF